MFTPEFSIEAEEEIVFVSAHNLTADEGIEWSIEYNRARVAFGRRHGPLATWKFRIIYDIRGQNLPDNAIDRVKTHLSDVASVEFKR